MILAWLCRSNVSKHKGIMLRSLAINKRSQQQMLIIKNGKNTGIFMCYLNAQ